MNCQNCNADMERLRETLHWCSRCGTLARADVCIEPMLAIRARVIADIMESEVPLPHKWTVQRLRECVPCEQNT